MSKVLTPKSDSRTLLQNVSREKLIQKVFLPQKLVKTKIYEIERKTGELATCQQQADIERLEIKILYLHRTWRRS